MLKRIVLRMMVLVIVLGSGAMIASAQLAQALVPWLSVVTRNLDRTFRVESFQVENEGGEAIFRTRLGLARPLTVDGRTYLPDARGQALSSTPVSNLLVPAVVLLSMAFAVPGCNSLDYLCRAALLLPALILIGSFGVPLILLGNLWRLVTESVAPDRFSPLVAGADFLLNGGQTALAVALAVVIVTVSHRFCRPRSAENQSARLAP